MNGGDKVIESLSIVIGKLNSEIIVLKQENQKLMDENNALRGMPNNNKDMISQIVKETIKQMPRPTIIRRFNRKRKSIIQNRIQNLASRNLSISDIKEIIVEQEQLCSRASFYRYINNLKNKQKIDTVKIDDTQILSVI